LRGVDRISVRYYEPTGLFVNNLICFSTTEVRLHPTLPGLLDSFLAVQLASVVKDSLDSTESPGANLANTQFAQNRLGKRLE
jgi:hypothetical protein